MVKYDNEEHLKVIILDIFTKYHDETSSDRRQVHFAHLCELIYKWCKDFQFKKEIDNMGEAIIGVTQRIMGDRTTKNIPGDKDEFFAYLRTAINREKINTSLNNKNDDSKLIKIPKGEKSKLKKVENLLRMKESYLGRKLTTKEQEHIISRWFNIQIYNNIINAISIGRLEFTHNDDEMDNLNSLATPIYMGNISINPLNELFLKECEEIICNAIETILEESQERIRDCYRALFTVHCLKNSKDCENLYSVLDAKILDSWQQGDQILNQSEIYSEYHPNAMAPEVSASTALRNFLKELKKYLKEKNPEILY